MRFKDKSVTPIRVGLDPIGIVGLHDALKKTDDLDPDDREGAVRRIERAWIERCAGPSPTGDPVDETEGARDALQSMEPGDVTDRAGRAAGGGDR
jgi:hypothetical protein